MLIAESFSRNKPVSAIVGRCDPFQQCFGIAFTETDRVNGHTLAVEIRDFLDQRPAKISVGQEVNHIGVQLQSQPQCLGGIGESLRSLLCHP